MTRTRLNRGFNKFLAQLVPSLSLIGLVVLQPELSCAASLDLNYENAIADQVHSNGKTALMLTARDGDLSQVKALLANGADINKTNNNGGTPLMYAALGGSLEIVRLLIERGARIDDAARNGWCALMIATTKGHADIVSELLARGANPNLQDVYGWTPLMRAVFENRRNTARLLLDHNAIDVNHQGENGVTALHIAVVRGFEHFVRPLVRGGANLELMNHAGDTPYAIAEQEKRHNLLNLLK